MPPQPLLVQDGETQQSMASFSSGHPDGMSVQELETLVRIAVFKPVNVLVGYPQRGISALSDKARRRRAIAFGVNNKDSKSPSIVGGHAFGRLLGN